MLSKWQNIATEETQSSDIATARYDLPDQGALHALMIKAQVTNGATSGRNVTLLNAITEIRIVSERQNPIFSLTSQELEKWGEIWMKGNLPAVHNEQASAVQEMVFPIFFGRELYDPEYFLPLSRHKKVQVEIDYSFTAAADGGFATGTLKFDVKALITPNEALLSYGGTLTVRRLYTHTTVASGDQPFYMPGASVIRAIGIYCYEAAVADDTDFSKIVVQNTRDSENILEQGWDDFIHNTFLTVGGILKRVITALAQDNDTVITRLGEILAVNVTMRLASDQANDVAYRAVVDAIAGDTLTLDVTYIEAKAGTEEVNTYATDSILDIVVDAKYPSYFGLVPFFMPDSELGYWNEADLGNLKVIATQGGAGGTAKVSIQELVRF